MLQSAQLVPVALVTGASSGIGLASACALREAGFRVYAGARRPADLAKLEGLGLRPVPLDVTDASVAASAVAFVERDGGALDVLVNNAGYGVHGPLEEVSLGALRALFEVNVYGALRMAQLVLPGMRRRSRGRIINMGSVGGLFTAPAAGAYHMSKYAVESMSDALRMEVKRFGVDVVLLEPTGVKNTPFLDKQLGTMSTDVDGARAATSRRPRSRYLVGAAAHVLACIRRMTSDALFDRIARSQFPEPPEALSRGSGAP